MYINTNIYVHFLFNGGHPMLCCGLERHDFDSVSRRFRDAGSTFTFKDANATTESLRLFEFVQLFLVFVKRAFPGNSQLDNYFWWINDYKMKYIYVYICTHIYIYTYIYIYRYIYYINKKI